MEKNNSNKLGRGLATLIGERTNFSILGNGDKNKSNNVINILEIDLDLIDSNPKQPRKKFDKEKLEELGNSIKQYGLIEPVILKEKYGGRYEIIAGERRVLASRMVGLKIIPSIIRHYDDDEKSSFILSIIENVQRLDLNCIEEANAYSLLNKEFGISMENIASVVGKSRGHVNNLIRLLSLPDKIQKHVFDGKLTMGHARVLINYPYAEEIADYIADNDLSVRDTEKLIKNEKTALTPITEHIKKHVIRDFLEFENELGYDCKISYQERTGKYHLAMDFKNYSELGEFVKNVGKK